MKRRSAIFAMLACTACAPPRVVSPDAQRASLHTQARANADPTVMGPRLVPETIEDERSFGIEPGGGVRSIASGVRIVSLPSGAVLAAEDRLPVAPSLTAAMPERLGGGFLFVLGNVVWRAERWLAPARPIFHAASSLAIARIVVGLDRVYLRSQNGAHQAIDPRNGAAMDMGPWPASSFVGGYAAADGWRAVAIDDLRGPVATFDAGATWRPLGLPIDAREVTLVGDAIAIGGQDASRASTWFEVRADGQIGRLASAPSQASVDRSSADAAGKAFGKRPLVAALEDGWPLADGTAVFARDGALARVRLDDGALLEVANDAFPLKPSQCHPVPFAQGGDPGAFGFVCGEARGATVLYSYDAGHLTEARRFDAPRVVLSSGNGAVAVRGPCAPGGTDDDATMHAYCTRPRDGAWHEVHVRGEIGGERVVILADGRFVIVSPPQGDLATARLTVLEAGRGRSVPIAFPPLAQDVLHTLKVGVWLDGFEERRPGVLGGWIEAEGVMLGIEIPIDGKAKVGAYVRDAGWPMVSGRYGLGWSDSRRGYETIDGGMTWTPLDVPDRIAKPAVRARACGPIGCTAAGWLRVGWGASKLPPAPNPPAPAAPPMYGARPTIALTCDAPPREPPHPLLPLPRVTESIARAAGQGASDLPAFYNFAPPAIRSDERSLSYESSELVERNARLGAVARVYAWGPRSGEWEHASKWTARWLWPYGASSEARASQAVAAPTILLDVARFGASAGSVMMPPAWSFAPGDDGAHGLLIARRSALRDAVVYEVEADRAPLEIRRADGDPFLEIDSAIRAGGRWYIATPPSQGDLAYSIVWAVDGPVARELARIPRAGMDARPTGAHLARRTDGRAIALVVDGQPTAYRLGATRWALSIDLESGALGEPEALGAVDLSDRPKVTICDQDSAGWIMDTAFPGQITLQGGAVSIGPLSSLLVRTRLSPSAACVERVAGALDSYAAEHLPQLPRAGLRNDEATVNVAVYASRSRQVLRCVAR